METVKYPAGWHEPPDDFEHHKYCPAAFDDEAECVCADLDKEEAEHNAEIREDR